MFSRIRRRRACSGWKVKDLLGRPGHATLHHRHADGTAFPKEQCPIYTTLQTGQERRVNGEAFWRKDGTSFPVEYTTTAIRGEKNEVIGAVVVFSDITERKHAEEILRDSEEKFRQFAENIDDVFWMTSVDMHTIHYVSPAFEQVWGLPAKALYADPNAWISAIVPEDREQVFTTFQKLADEASVNIEYRLRRPDGSIRWIHDRGFQIRDAGGKIYRTAGIAVDITERKRIAETVADLNKQLVVAARQSGMAEVASSVLHNAGNVLNSINVSATLVTEKVKDSKLAGLVKVAALLKEQEGRLNTFLVEDPRGRKLPEYFNMLASYWQQEQAAVILELTNLNNNIQHVKDIISMQQSLTGVSGIEEPVKISHVLQNAMNIVEASYKHNHIAVSCDIHDIPPSLIEKSRLIQILVNLLQNSNDALSKLPANNRAVSIKARLIDDHYAIEVSDNGVGMRPEDLTRIFSYGFTTKSTGHGIGLHTSALSAQDMGGALTATSEGPGKGATFLLTIPFKAIGVRK